MTLLMIILLFESVTGEHRSSRGPMAASLTVHLYSIRSVLRLSGPCLYVDPSHTLYLADSRQFQSFKHPYQSRYGGFCCTRVAWQVASSIAISHSHTFLDPSEDIRFGRTTEATGQHKPHKSFSIVRVSIHTAKFCEPSDTFSSSSRILFMIRRQFIHLCLESRLLEQ